MATRTDHLRTIKLALDSLEQGLTARGEDALTLKELARVQNAKAFVYWELAAEHAERQPIREYSQYHQTTHRLDSDDRRRVVSQIHNHDAMIVAESQAAPTTRPPTSMLTNDELGSAAPQADNLIFVGAKVPSSSSCVRCSTAGRIMLLFFPSNLVMQSQLKDLLDVKQEDQRSFQLLCYTCAVAMMNSAWLVNREWLCVDSCELDRWEFVPRAHGWEKYCKVHRTETRTSLMYRFRNNSWLLWRVNRAGCFDPPIVVPSGNRRKRGR